jgi:hypothetical protein
MPKQVPATHAVNVRCLCDMVFSCKPAGGCSVNFFFVVAGVVTGRALELLLIQIFQDLRVENGAGDAVCPAGPLSQVDQPASIAAERELLVGPGDRFATRGATQGFGRARHKLTDASDEIVVMRLGDLAAHELSGFELVLIAEVIDEEFAVDLGCVHFGAPLPQQIRVL